MPSDKYVSADEDNASAYLSEDTVSSWLRNHREQRADCNAIEFDDGQITYAQLSKKVGRLATGLRELGIRQRDIVAIQLPNCPEFIISYLAICSLGAVVQTLHMPYQRKELEYLLQDSNAKAVICLSSFKDYNPASIFHDVNAAKKLGLQIVTLGSSISDTHDYSDLEERDEIHRSEPQQADLPFVLLYTSGTTADPKGVIHKYDSFLGNAIVAAQELGVSESDRILSLAAFSHLYGLFTLNMTLAVGGTVILLPAFSPPAFKDVLTSLAPTCVFAAPAHFIASTKDSFVGSDELSTVRVVCFSGATVPVKLATEVDAMLPNGKVIQLWGMTELQAGTYGRPSDAQSARLESAGRTAPGTRMRVVDTDQVEVPADNEGELQVRGPSVFSEYLNKAEESKSAFSDDGWFLTGDLATISENGCLKITGRIKELINRGGVKYNPIEVESVLAGMKQIELCAVAPLEDEVLGETACLFVILKDDHNLALEQVTNYLESAGIAKYKWPERIKVVTEMPMTPTGKVVRGNLSVSIERT